MNAPHQTWKTIAVQGEPGAYGHMAAAQACPQAKIVACPTFEEAFSSVQDRKIDGAMIPIENSTMGRIADIHHLLPESDLNIVGEHYLPVRHALMAAPGATLKTIKEVHSQLPALRQCTQNIKKLKLKAVPAHDTAGAARMVAEKERFELAAIASELAAKIYGLNILKVPLNDIPENTTRFVMLGRKAWVPPLNVPCKTSMLFQTRSIPAALYKALGGFATNGINLSKIESYLVGGRFNVVQFYIDADDHQNSPAMKHALEELKFFSNSIKLLGCYPQTPNA